MHISGDSPSPKKWAKLVHQKRFGMWSLTKSLTKLFWLSSNHICRMDIYRKIRSLNVVFIVLVTKFTKIFQLLILDLKMCSFSHHKRWRVSTRKKIIFFQKCCRSSFEGYKKWMHQKIRSLNVFFIVLDTKVTKRVPAYKWAGYCNCSYRVFIFLPGFDVWSGPGCYCSANSCMYWYPAGYVM